MTKYVFVTGGVVSGLGKGITASSIALLLKSRGYKVFMQKFDPYMNVDPGTMSPYQHGEVFVTADGSETDLDLGHYERFIDEELNYSSSITNGKIYHSVITKERKGEYLGATVQIVPHITNEIKNKVYEAGSSSKADIVITEIGGTIGDIESLSFLEALRQIRYEIGEENTFFVITTLVPRIYGSGELKTKPTQHSVIELRGLGIQPDAVVCRSPIPMGEELKKKISLYCSLPKENVIEAVDVKNIYEIPINFYQQNIDEVVLNHFKMPTNKIDLSEWKNLIATVESLEREVEIALVGKYVELHDSYISVVEALNHAGYKNGVKIKLKWIDSEALDDSSDIDLKELFKKTKAIVVPGGFGTRGIDGKIRAIKYAREKGIPFLGLCLGLQLAVIEFARNVCGLEKADSTEFDELTPEPIIDLMTEQKTIINLGGTMRLGNYKCSIKEGTLAHEVYESKNILERHRHRYEFNNKYKKILEEKGFVFSGVNKESGLIEIVEYPSHPYFIACQFHPEFKSRPTRPHPLFDSLIRTSIKEKSVIKKEKVSI